MFGLRIIFLFLVSVPLLAAEPTTDVLASAAAAAKARKYKEAAHLYQQHTMKAIETGNCRLAVEGMAGLRETAYWARQSELLETIESPALWDLVKTQPACGAPVIAELAVAYEQAAHKEKTRKLMEKAVALSSNGPGEALFQRARSLVLKDISVELTPMFVDSSVETGSDIWESAFPVYINRRDQVLEGGDAWSGVQDASVDIRAGRMTYSLFIRLKVTDDHHITVGDRRDRIILSIDASRGSGTMSGRHPLRPKKPIVVELDTELNASPHSIPGINRAWKMVARLDGGYEVIVCFPKGTLGDFEIDSGNRYAIDIMIEDVDPDGSSTLRWMELSTDPKVLYWAGVLSFS